MEAIARKRHDIVSLAKRIDSLVRRVEVDFDESLSPADKYPRLRRYEEGTGVRCLFINRWSCDPPFASLSPTHPG